MKFKLKVQTDVLSHTLDILIILIIKYSCILVYIYILQINFIITVSLEIYQIHATRVSLNKIMLNYFNKETKKEILYAIFHLIETAQNRTLVRADLDFC